MKEKLKHNLGLKILAFFAAAILWLIVVNIDDPTAETSFINIPVTVLNDDVITQEGWTYQIVENTGTVSVLVRAKRSVLGNIKNSDIIATADMKELTMGTQVPIRVKINGLTTGNYESANATPRNLLVKLEEEASNKFPITPTTVGTVRDGYVLGDLKVSPERVSIRGPESLIKRISKVVAEVTVRGLSEDATIKSEMVLYDADNNVISQSLLVNNLGTEGVSVEVQILNTKKVPINFDTSKLTAASGYSISGITHEPTEIQIAGRAEYLKDVTTIEVPAEALEMADITEKTEKIVDITPYLPENIKLADENAGSVVVTASVAKDGTRSFDVSIGSLVVDNVAEGLKLQYGTTDEVVLQIRGRKELLDDYTITKDTRISIDMSGYTAPGTFEVPVKIELPEGLYLDTIPTVQVILEKRTD
jgi:YbbR domain-containing protein